MATNLTTLFTNIANAIRVKTGSSEQIVAENFPTAIANISGVTDTGGQADGNTITMVTAIGKQNFVIWYSADSAVTDNVLILTAENGVLKGSKFKANGGITMKLECGTWDASTGKATLNSGFKFYQKIYGGYCW